MFESRFVETSGLRMHCRLRGDVDGPTILFVHGGFATSRWWAPVMALLPDDFSRVAPDLRGCGLTDKPDSGYTIEGMAQDLAQFIGQLGLRDIDLVAHGAGAAVAIECLLEHAPPVRSLTLVSGAPVAGIQTPPEAIRLLDLMRQDEALLRTALESLMPVLASESPGIFGEIVADAMQMAAPAFTEITLALGRWDRSMDTRRLTLPTLLLWGEEDPIVSRENMTQTLLAIPGAANLEVLHGVGHSPMLDAPLLFAERLVDFIAEDFAEMAAIRSRELS